MKSAWDSALAATLSGELAERVYSSRLIGADPSLVLHGGGNTSVKLRQADLFGAVEDVLYVKASGHDLKTIEAVGFNPLRLAQVRALVGLTKLSDLEMARQFQLASLDPDAPPASVESILHALLPHKYVDHAHADAVVTLTNTPSGLEHVRSAYGERVIVVPYVKPGFDLSRLTAELVRTELGPETVGLVLMGHGVVSFGESARQSYERLVELVTTAEEYLERHAAWALPATAGPSYEGRNGVHVAQLRQQVSMVAGVPLIVQCRDDPLALDFARRSDVEHLSQRGPATPDHSLLTKRVPLVGKDVNAYAAQYEEYFMQHAAKEVRQPPLQMLDPAPRVVLDPDLGLCTVGKDVAQARATGDIYMHTIEAILRAEALEHWQALSPGDIFEVEYWDLEQAKLRRRGSPPELTGEVALVTGAASGIGRAIAQSLVANGAAVCGLDLSQEVEGLLDRPSYLGITCDVTEEEAVGRALERVARWAGGIDILVLNAGIFPASARIQGLTMATWERTFAVNVDANLGLMRGAHPYLRLAPRGGRVLVVGSKNVKAPGPGAAAYSASKAALTQLCRVAALEWGRDGIRVNIIHPNAVFDTALWNEKIIAERANEYGLSPEDYRRKSVLGVEVTSNDVAELALLLCSHSFSKVTGAQIPIDGGNERVI